MVSTQIPYQVSHPNHFSLAMFAGKDNLLDAYHWLQRNGGEAPGEDGLTYTDFSRSAIVKALNVVSSAFCNPDGPVYTPYPTRIATIPRPDGRTRELRLHQIIDRVISKALQRALDDYWRSQLPLIGKDRCRLFADMERIMHDTRANWLVVDDVQNCFGTVPLDAVMECHRQYFSQPQLLWLIEAIVRGDSTTEPADGLAQGSPYSPIANGVLLHSRLDAPLVARYGELPRLLRYVDNLNLLCRSEREGSEALQFCCERLGELNMRLKGNDGPPMDLRENTQREVLGLIPSCPDGHLEFAIPESGFTDLELHFRQCTISRRPSAAARDLACGWLDSIGPALPERGWPAIIDRIIGIARSVGFTEARGWPLLKKCRAARRKWLDLVAEVRRGPRP